MYNEKVEGLIKAALADGELTEKEKQILFRKAEAEGIDLDEFEMVLDARLVELKKKEKAKVQSSAPKSEKLGDVRKCPQCGAVIGSFQMSCPECGFEFSGLGPNKFVETFSKELMQITRKAEDDSKSLFDAFDTNGIYKEKKQRKFIVRAEINLVKNYPLPMTKEDCVEMLNFMLPRTLFSGSTGATKTWRSKFNTILTKLEHENQGNQTIKELVTYYREQTKLSGFKNFCLWYKSLSGIVKTMFWVVIVYALMFGVGGYFMSAQFSESHGIEKVQKLIDAGDIAGAKLRVQKGASSTPLYEYYMQNQMWEEAEEFIPNKSTHYEDVNEAYFQYIKKVITSMCKDGRKQEAKRFIKRKVVFYEEYNNKDEWGHKEWNTTIISKKLNAIIDNY